MAELKVFPKRVLHQCYLWDCMKGSQPYCNVEHEHVAMVDEDLPHSFFFVDGVSLDKESLLSFKILTVKTLNQYCGVPLIDSEIFTQPPWLLEEFDMNREAMESGRSWLFMSGSVLHGDLWVATEQRYVHGIECTIHTMYENPEFGRFTLCQYRSPFYEDSVYWLNFNESNVGSWRKFLETNADNAQKNKITGDDNRRCNAGISEKGNFVNQLSGMTLLDLHR